MKNYEELTPEEKEKIIEAKRQYHRNYYHKNKKKIRSRQKQWRMDNPDKVARTNQNFWLKKAKQKA